LLTNYLGI